MNLETTNLFDSNVAPSAEEAPQPRAWLMLELGVAFALVAMIALSYFLLTSQTDPTTIVDPPVVAALLVGVLVPATALMVLMARRVALRRAARSPMGGRGRLHVRLVALFSIIASVPTLLVVIFASVLFQSGTDFWFSGRARGMLENASAIAQENYRHELDRVDRDTVTMAGDIANTLSSVTIENPQFAEYLVRQDYYRNLSESILMRVTPDRGVQTLALVDPYERTLQNAVRPEIFRQLAEGRQSVIIASGDRIGAVTRLPGSADVYLYAARVYEPYMISQIQRGNAVLTDYHAMYDRSRALQFRFNAALLIISLLIVGAAIWVALTVADRLVRPVGQLVDAARRVTAGDLSARVPEGRAVDEIATLGDAFNRMTDRLQEQTGALVTANAQLESRRSFIEAVLSGVTAGVLSVDRDRVVRLINSSAESLLKTGKGSALGQRLADLAPELDRQLNGGEGEDIIQLTSGGEARTLAVKIVRVANDHVLTFDDITAQLIDQRRAAWSDVARRIAHEIKNPLTPIQLAAERLQRRYGKEVSSDPATFEQLTGTIVRQVGDLRRMVDEFSSFARMPKPVFHEEPVVDIARQALFLHEVAHPEIAFALEAPDPSPVLVCDRRLLGQALTNVVKNGVEAIQQKREAGKASDQDRVLINVAQQNGQLRIEVTDTGIGLPADRGRITEPYMTTRVRGTGLGLAIVKKIVEEHFGQIGFADAAGGGTIVTFTFDAETLRRLGGAGVRASEDLAAQS